MDERIEILIEKGAYERPGGYQWGDEGWKEKKEFLCEGGELPERRPSRFKEFVSPSGERFIQDSRYHRQENLMKGWLNKCADMGQGLYKHVILTQDHEHYIPKIRDRFRRRLNRYFESRGFGKVQEVWSVEIQDGRAEDTGEVVLHWHVVLFVPGMRPSQFTGDDMRAIKGMWDFGIVRFGKPVRKPSLKYLMKYIADDLGSDLAREFKVHRVGSTQVEGFWRRSAKKLSMALARYGGWVRDGVMEVDWKGVFIRRPLTKREIEANEEDPFRCRWRSCKSYWFLFPLSGWRFAGCVAEPF
jgi:hypothetical protein